MAYIYLKELKKILPGILDQWIDKDDESWEWIFSEIEQKCHVGKHKYLKGKKWKKKLRDDVDELQYFRHNEYEIKVNGIATRVNELNNKVSKLNDICNAHTVRLDNISRDITAAKSMAQTAKQRTEVDYSKYKQPISYGLWSDCKRVIETCGRYGATKEELEQLNLIMSKYIRNPSKTTEPVESCTTCKHYRGDGIIEEPCITCNSYEHWEAKNE